MLRNMMIDVLRDTWPILVICSIIFVSMRIVYLVKSDKKIYILRKNGGYKDAKKKKPKRNNIDSISNNNNSIVNNCGNKY